MGDGGKRKRMRRQSCWSRQGEVREGRTNTAATSREVEERIEDDLRNMHGLQPPNDIHHLHS